MLKKSLLLNQLINVDIGVGQDASNGINISVRNGLGECLLFRGLIIGSSIGGSRTLGVLEGHCLKG
jgi:hypothetical protein